MKSFSLIKALGTVAVLIAVVAFLGSSVYGEAPALRIPVIEGTITDIDKDNNCLLIQGSDILGSESLYLRAETKVFMGYEGVNFDEINRNAMATSTFERAELSDLYAGYEVCCTYSYSKDGKLYADSIVITTPSTLVPSM